MSSESTNGTERPSDLERFAIECALDAAWGTEFWVPADPDYGFVDYVEAAVARNFRLLRGFEELAEDVDERGILPPVDGDQAKLVTDGGTIENDTRRKQGEGRQSRRRKRGDRRWPDGGRGHPRATAVARPAADVTPAGERGRPRQPVPERTS